VKKINYDFSHQNSQLQKVISGGPSATKKKRPQLNLSQEAFYDTFAPLTYDEEKKESIRYNEKNAETFHEVGVGGRQFLTPKYQKSFKPTFQQVNIRGYGTPKHKRTNFFNYHYNQNSFNYHYNQNYNYSYNYYSNYYQRKHRGYYWNSNYYVKPQYKKSSYYYDDTFYKGYNKNYYGYKPYRPNYSNQYTYNKGKYHNSADNRITYESLDFEPDLPSPKSIESNTSILSDAEWKDFESAMTERLIKRKSLKKKKL